MTAPTIKRVYDPPAASDGTRILVDRLWPRGLSKAAAQIDLWLKDIAPSGALRKQVHSGAIGWEAFCAAYDRELQGAEARAAAKILRERLRDGPVVLLYAAHDEKHNNAVALRAWLKD
jgi:uncharacterized protein YeaO (DUF488 family)